MVEIPSLIVSTMCVQIYILAAVFFLTCRIMTPRRSQIPTSLLHQDYIVKRDLFITYIGFFEMTFIFVVHIEMCLQTHRIVHTAEKRCSEFRCDDRINLVTYAVLACILLSIVRCLVQRYVLERLSKPDVASMTKVYLLPSTYFVALLCIRSWFQLLDERELIQPNRVICYQKVQWPTAVVQNKPVSSYLFILALITINFIYDLVASGGEEQPGFPPYGFLCSNFIRRSRKSLKQANTCTKHTVKYPQPKYPRTTVIYDFAKTPHFTFLIAKESRIETPKINAIPYSNSVLRVEQNYTELDRSWRKYFPGSTLSSNAPSSSKSIWKFLCGSIRLYLALTVYFAIFVGCYQCTEYLLVGSFLEDFIPVIFASLVIVNSFLRAVQIASAGTHNEEKTHHVVICKNLPSLR